MVLENGSISLSKNQLFEHNIHSSVFPQVEPDYSVGQFIYAFQFHQVVLFYRHGIFFDGHIWFVIQDQSNLWAVTSVCPIINYKTDTWCFISLPSYLFSHPFSSTYEWVFFCFAKWPTKLLINRQVVMCNYISPSNERKMLYIVTSMLGSSSFIVSPRWNYCPLLPPNKLSPFQWSSLDLNTFS